MPLRDHFHSPVNDTHSWDELPGLWPSMMVLQLSKLLPKEFFAAPNIHLGAVEIDVATFERDDLPDDAPFSTGGGTATATATEPTLWRETESTICVETDFGDLDEYEVRVYDASRTRRLVAAVELVSPANKDRPDSRRAFLTKCAALLQQDVCVTIVDVVTNRDFNLYADLLAFFEIADRTVAAPPKGIYAVTCRGKRPRKKWVFEAWHRPLAVGQPLPALPVWLTPDLRIPLDLEASYEETCRVLRIT